MKWLSIPFLACALGLAPNTNLGAAELAGFSSQILVSSSAGYGEVMVDPTLRNGWGIANRPAEKGLGGHFWISSEGNGTSNQYVGDVNGTALHQDTLVNMDVPPFTPGYTPPSPSGPETFIPDGQGVSHPTGQTWQQTSGFMVTLPHLNGTINAPAKFIFATSEGVISSWTDTKQPDGTSNWVGYSVPVIDQSASGSSFYGITVSSESGFLYTADLGTNPGIKVFNPDYSERTTLPADFNPFAGADGVQPGEFAPFNIQTLNLNGSGNLFVTYEKTIVDPANSGQILPGLGEIGDGLGRLAEYTPDGDLVAVWDDKGLLNSPYGMALAPSTFGLASDMLLIGNAGDGTIVAFDTTSRSAVDYLRNTDGSLIHFDGLKGLVFGNGLSVGDADTLYFTGGPLGGTEGIFGKVQAVPEPSSLILAACAGACLAGLAFRRRVNGGSRSR